MNIDELWRDRKHQKPANRFTLWQRLQFLWQDYAPHLGKAIAAFSLTASIITTLDIASKL